VCFTVVMRNRSSRAKDSGLATKDYPDGFLFPAELR
jgi:hypothetical protein